MFTILDILTQACMWLLYYVTCLPIYLHTSTYLTCYPLHSAKCCKDGIGQHIPLQPMQPQHYEVCTYTAYRPPRIPRIHGYVQYSTYAVGVSLPHFYLGGKQLIDQKGGKPPNTSGFPHNPFSLSYLPPLPIRHTTPTTYIRRFPYIDRLSRTTGRSIGLSQVHILAGERRGERGDGNPTE